MCPPKSLKHLKIDCDSLKKTISRIKNVLLKEYLEKEVDEFFKERIDEINENLNDPNLTSTDYLLEECDNLKIVIKSVKLDIEEWNVSDSRDNSKAIAKQVMRLIEQPLEEFEQQFAPPQNISIKEKSYWKENRLRLEQQFLLKDGVLTDAFTSTLGSIKSSFRKNRILPPQEIFICYAWPDDKDEQENHLHWVQPFLVGLRTHLRLAGISAKLDIKDNPPGGNIYNYMKATETAEYVLLIGTESLLKKHEKGTSAVCTELIKINRKRETDRKSGDYKVFGILISGTYQKSFPAHYELYTTVRDWKGKTAYYQNLCQLIAALYKTKVEAFGDILEKQFLTKISEEERLILTERLSKESVIEYLIKEKELAEHKKIIKKNASDKLLDRILLKQDSSKVGKQKYDDKIAQQEEPLSEFKQLNNYQGEKLISNPQEV